MSISNDRMTALVSLNLDCVLAEKGIKSVKAETRVSLITALVPVDGDAHGEYLKNWEELKKGLKAAKAKMSGSFKSTGSQILRALEAGVSLYAADGTIRTRKEVSDDIKAAEGPADENAAPEVVNVPLHVQPVADRLAIIHAYAMGLDEAACIKLTAALDTFRTKYCK